MTEEDEAFNEIERRSKAKQEAVRTAIRQCSSCGGFCKKSGCERKNVEMQQRTWVRLTADEVSEILEIGLSARDSIETALEKIERKNT